MRKVLIVSSYFPPLGSAGNSIRLIKFLKHLTNWKFVVFTQDIRQTIVSAQMLSGFLLGELPADIVIKRVAAPFASSQPALQKSDPEAGHSQGFQRMFANSSLPWGLKAFWKGLTEFRKSQFDLIFGVTPPFTNALVMALLGWFGRKPFVLDLKDDWVGSATFLEKSVLRQKAETVLERLIVRSASAIVTTTPQSYRLYVERYQQLVQAEKFHLIPNGCDLEEYESLRHRARKIASDRFLILSAAWGFRKDYRDLRPFLFALDAFFKRHPEAKDRVEVVLLGDSLSADYDELLAELSLEKAIRRMGSVQRSDLLEWLWKADLFLLIQPVNNTTAVSGTLYEYWATGKAPVLLISEEGASSALVEDNRIGRHFHFTQIEQIEHYIEEIFHAYETGSPVWIEPEGIRGFDRKLLADRMEEVWKTALS